MAHCCQKNVFANNVLTAPLMNAASEKEANFSHFT
jgi:hypothetical protein